MSKTHKITQLKKRIAELEAKLNRREDISSNPIRCVLVEKGPLIPVKTELHLSIDSFEQMRNIPVYQEHFARMLVESLSHNDDFTRTARVEFMTNDVNHETVRARAAIQVAPYYGDIWED